MSQWKGNDERLTDFLLKLPKAHRWAVHEFFYSDIDYSLLEGESEFKLCLKETFPQLRWVMNSVQIRIFFGNFQMKNKKRKFLFFFSKFFRIFFCCFQVISKLFMLIFLFEFLW